MVGQDGPSWYTLDLVVSALAGALLGAIAAILYYEQICNGLGRVLG